MTLKGNSSSGGGFFNGVLDVAGKIWALPNTLVGLAYGGDPVYYQPDSQRGQYWLGYEEMQHTYQAQVLGPLYFPAHIVSGLTGLLMNWDWHGSSAFMESSVHWPDSVDPRPWP